MNRTVVGCSTTGCSEPAVAKVAAPWSYGRFHELKTYGFACAGHLTECVQRAQAKRKPRLDQGEEVGAIGTHPMSPA